MNEFSQRRLQRVQEKTVEHKNNLKVPFLWQHKRLEYQNTPPLAASATNELPGRSPEVGALLAQKTHGQHSGCSCVPLAARFKLQIMLVYVSENYWLQDTSAAARLADKVI
jgi:hypothetical protein